MRLSGRTPGTTVNSIELACIWVTFDPTAVASLPCSAHLSVSGVEPRIASMTFICQH